MKVIIIEMNNAQDREDYNSWISATFFSHKDAALWLEREGFRPFSPSMGEEPETVFIKEHNLEAVQSGFPLEATIAQLIEMDVFGSPAKTVANCQDDGWFS